MKDIFHSVKLPDFYLLRQAAKENFQDWLNLPYIKPLSGLVLLFIILSLVFSFAIIKSSSQDLLILHYNVNSGIDLIGGLNKLYVIPVLGLVILTANAVVSMIVKKDRKFFSYLLIFASLAANAYLLLSLGLIYIINFR